MQLKHPLILASQSPRRQQLLREAGISFEVLVRPNEEELPLDVSPRAAAVMISEAKATIYTDLSAKNIILTADTIVAVGGEMLAKPADADEAAAMLDKLSDKTHSVVTGVTLFHKGNFRSFAVETKVTFRKLTAAEIGYYIETYQPFDKAGGYGIQEWIGMVGITAIEGDYYNVVGLPVAAVYRELQTYKL